MTHTVYIKGKPILLTDKLGSGWEAHVYRAKVDGALMAVKVILNPETPDFHNKPAAQQKAALDRLNKYDYAQLLAAFPAVLPREIVRAIETVCDSHGRTVGFTMHLLPPDCEGARLYADHEFREKRNITMVEIVMFMLELRRVIREGHAAGIIFGDALSGNNVQFGAGKAWVIDWDSIEPNGFPNWTHTREFVDPKLCKPNELVLAKPHSIEGDWYNYHAILVWLMLLVHPYFDGFYTPDEDMSDDDRALGGISVFHPDVELPRAAIDPKYLPDDLRLHLENVFKKDGLRGDIPDGLLENFVWTICQCGVGHGHDTCPDCGTPAPGNRNTRQGQVEATLMLTTPDGYRIGCVTTEMRDGESRMLYAYTNNTDIQREGAIPPLLGVVPDPAARILISGDRTAIVFDGTITVHNPDGTIGFKADDVADGNETIGSNSDGFYWITLHGAIMRTPTDGTDRAQRLGVIAGPEPTMWIGEQFGVAFWRQVTGKIYTFDSERRGLKILDLPVVPGELIDAHCTISSRLAWLFIVLKRGDNTFNYCYVIDREGSILASAEAPSGDGSWLGAGIRTHVATQVSIFTPTPAGLVRAELEGAELLERDPHVNSAPFVQGVSRLLIGEGGIITVTDTNVTKLVNR